MKTVRRFQPTLLPTGSNNVLATCFLILSGFTGLLFILVLFLSYRINQIAVRKTTFVQLVDGRPVIVSEQDWNYRLPTVVQEVVRKWTMLTWNWDSRIPGTEVQDEGYKIGSKQITTAAYVASFLLEGKDGKNQSSFREEARKQIAELTPATVFSGGTRAIVLISYVSEPRSTAPGVYKVDMIATCIVVNRNSGEEEEIPFNRTFTLKVVDIPQTPLAEKASVFEHEVYNVRSAGLVITNIQPFTPQ